MRNIIYIFLVFVLVFFLNLLLYIYVDSYRDFIKTLKYGEDFISYEAEVDDSYNVNSIEYRDNKSEAERWLLLDLWIDENSNTSLAGNSQRQEVIRPDSVTIETSFTGSTTREREVWESVAENTSGNQKLTPVTLEIIEAFQKSWFEILERAEKDDLLDIAREYPDDYIQYGNNNFDLYILYTRTYDEVDDIFTVLEFEMPYTLNKTNSFWDQSFFINLDRPDQKVRFIFQYKGEVYGIKVRSPNYNAVKDILNTL